MNTHVYISDGIMLYMPILNDSEWYYSDNLKPIYWVRVWIKELYPGFISGSTVNELCDLEHVF